ncbi:Mitochondrial antiviral-signaling protein [Cuculus canorus]|uniref:Mitochondrial antiviral-signaling protein n=1 Tax=Cuculus canorus TaxID=55661 RepID=A0A091GDV1_CUCCA|nr:Mitochondrial antiviral-signaling protein [Cuculus canorus]
MGFAEDKVYDYILKNLKKFKNIRVASLTDSLSCLTDDDRDELHAREETRGSHATVYRFYQHLRCCQGWVPDLIDALRHNNAGHLADELQHVYDSWQPRPPAPAAGTFPPAAGAAHPAVSSVDANMPSLQPNPAPGAPLAEQVCQELPIGGHSPLPPGAATTMSTDLDARAPVQESLPKNLLDQESPRPPPPGSMVCDGVSDGGEGHLPHPIKAVEVAAGPPVAGSVATPSPDPPERGRDWLGRQQHPVCVDNGYFGNANHLHRGSPALGLGRSFAPRNMGAARRNKQPRNEPEENSYISTESPLRLEEAARSKEPQPPATPPKKQAVPGFENCEPLGSFVDVRSPLLIQQQFDAEQKQIRMLQERGDAQMETTTPVTTPAPRDAFLSCDTSVKPPVQETKPPTGKMASRTLSMPMKEKVLPAPAEPLLTVAGSSEGTPGRTASHVSSATSIWTSYNNVEMDVELSKPGVLLSVSKEGPEAAERHLNSQRPSGPDSGASSSLTFSSDPLMVSTDSLSSGETLSRVSLRRPAPATNEDPGGERAAGASRDSCPSPSLDSTSLGIHEIHVDHYPSAQLEAGNDLRDGTSPLGNSQVFDSSRSHDAAKSSSQAKGPPGDSNESSLLYVVTAVAIAVISVTVFLVYARLRK